MIEVAACTQVHVIPCLAGNPFASFSIIKPRIRLPKRKTIVLHGSFDQTVGGQLLRKGDCYGNDKGKGKSTKRVFFLDVNPLRYEGSKPSLHSFGHWISLFFGQVSHSDPVIAVLDGERGNEHRRQLLPSYKAHRRKFIGQLTASQRFSRALVGKSHRLIIDVLGKCNVPDTLGENFLVYKLTTALCSWEANMGRIAAHFRISGYDKYYNEPQVVKIEGQEADDVVATLAEQVLQRGYRVVIASPDKDFKQLISEDVQLVMPLKDLDRWSFYTLKHYIAQYNCDPHFDLSLRCIMGDEVDGVPGIQHMVPGFGRKTALKLLKKHGSLENLLNAAAVRTVGRQYAQEALTKYADFLRRNYEVLALRRDIDVHLEQGWLVERDTHNDSITLSNFFESLEDTQKLTHHRYHFSNG